MPTLLPHASLRHVLVAIGVCAVLMLSLVPASSQADSESMGATALDKIDPALMTEFDEDATKDFWVYIEGEADLRDAARIRHRGARGRAVVRELKDVAAETQRDVRSVLKQQNIRHDAFYISNVIYVPDGTEQLARTLARRPDVERVEVARTYRVPELRKASAQATVDDVEWGVAAIRADETWERFKTKGEGIVIGSIDTGVEWDHPALRARYRGVDGRRAEHDYNWFDPAAVCRPASEPCDNNGHGTHTMGTMVGDGGTANQIGVAVNARWIAAKGCEGLSCTSESLLRSGEWMLAPTDLNGDNPRPDLRPDIVNNSWGGANFGLVSLWYADVIKAWRAAGMFPVFANGNEGDDRPAPACDTSGSPGDNAVAYSVGAVDSAGAVAAFSSRGPGENGDFKPNIAAPGAAVRSSAPGGRYSVASGTSMAAPHVSGAVALLWSATPALRGDVDGTEAILDGTAVDTEDLSCGGTIDDNNVYGEGLLDVHAAVESAARDDAGLLTGTVRDAASGDPVPGAIVTIHDGNRERSIVAEADGSYRLWLVEGHYDVRATSFGYEDASLSGVVVIGQQTVESDVEMTKLPLVTVSGTVVDGSGQGWPLYAEVEVRNTGITGLTDPTTGRYSFELPVAEAYRLTVRPQYGGYVGAHDHDVEATGDAHSTIKVPVDLTTCEAPGYHARYTGSTEHFDDGTLPAGWTATDDLDDHDVWVFDRAVESNAYNRNLTGGTGHYAGTRQILPGLPFRTPFSSALTTSTHDFSDVTYPVLEFRTDYESDWGYASIDLSVDGGASWSSVATLPSGWIADGELGPVRISLPSAAGKQDVRVRFRWESFSLPGTGQPNLDNPHATIWQVDDVFLGEKACEPVAGRLVVGHVTDATTGDPVLRARVDAGDGDSSLSIRTPLDPALDDGFYWHFAPATERAVTASLGGYGTARQKLPRGDDRVAHIDFAMPTARFDVSPNEQSVSLGKRQRAVRRFTITNTGTGAGTVNLYEQPLDTTAVSAEAGEPGRTAATTPTEHPVQRVPVPDDARDRDNVAGPLAVVTNAPDQPASPDPVSSAPFVPPGQSPFAFDSEAVEGPAAAEADAGTGQGTERAATWTPTDVPWWTSTGRAATDPETGELYVLGGRYSRHASATGDSRGDQVWRFTPRMGTWRQVTPVPEPAHWAVAFVDGRLYALGGRDGNVIRTTTWVYDPATDQWTAGARLPIAVWEPAVAVSGGKVYLVGGCGQEYQPDLCGRTHVLVYDPATDTWERAADYPRRIHEAACGGIGGRIYCTGGRTVRFVGANERVWASTYAYDPAADTWEQRADAPVAVHDAAFAASGVDLLVQNGLVDPTPATLDDWGETYVTNEGWAYDTSADRWRALPTSANPTYGDNAGACGAYRIGGSAVRDRDQPFWEAGDQPWMERLAGADDCADRTDVDWLTIRGGDELTLEPGESARVSIVYDAGEADAGRHSARVVVGQNTPYGRQRVPVTLEVR